MSDAELDQVYTDFCHALGEVGEGRATEALCRFALLAMLKIDDVAVIEEMTRRAFAAPS
jgi:hypothetical protein